MRAHIIALLILAIAVGLFPTSAAGARAPRPKPSTIAAVVQVTVIPVARAAAIVRELFPHVRVRTEGHANALVVSPAAIIEATGTAIIHKAWSSFSRAVSDQGKIITSVGRDDKDSAPYKKSEDRAMFYDTEYAQL